MPKIQSVVLELNFKMMSELDVNGRQENEIEQDGSSTPLLNGILEDVDESSLDESSFKELNENVSNFLTDFRTKNKLASKLDKLLADDASEVSDAEGESAFWKSDEEVKALNNYNLTRFNESKKGLKNNGESRARCRFINVLETPEDKLKNREEEDEDNDDEIIQQTPIGKIKRGGVRADSKLAVLLKNAENRLSIGDQSTSNFNQHQIDSKKNDLMDPQNLPIPSVRPQSIASNSSVSSINGVALPTAGVNALLNRKRGLPGKFNRANTAKRKIFFR